MTYVHMVSIPAEELKRLEQTEARAQELEAANVAKDEALTVMLEYIAFGSTRTEMQIADMVTVARQALSTTAGADLLEKLEKLEQVAEATKELNEVAILRGDNLLPAPPDDPKPWSARMQNAWNELDSVLADLGSDGKRLVKALEVTNCGAKILVPEPGKAGVE